MREYVEALCEENMYLCAEGYTLHTYKALLGHVHNLSLSDTLTHTEFEQGNLLCM